MSNAIYPTLPGLQLPVQRIAMPPPVQVRTTPSRREYRARDATLTRWQYGLSYEFLRSGRRGTELATLLAFYLAAGGPFSSWLFVDPDDSATTNQVFGTGNGSATAFQLLRSIGGFVEPVANIVGSPLIYKAGVLQTAGTHYTLSAGVITFAAAPAAGAALTWSGSYYQRCRFLGDRLDAERFLAELWSAKKVEFVTVLGED